MASIDLTREVRFSIDRDWVHAARGEAGFGGALPINNSWGGWPSAVGIAPYLILRATVRGSPDAATGYLVNITLIDQLLRQHAIPMAAEELSRLGVRATGEHLVRALWTRIEPLTPQPATLTRLELAATPYLRFMVHAGGDDMVEVMQEFEFSAAHRLHVDSLSDDENRATFGKCNNPNGHGHNYRVEVAIRGRPDKANGRILPLPKFEAIVQREVIDRLDHKHLNLDVPEFAAVNPSVENIAQVIWALLADKLAPAELSVIRVWETAKTCAEYRGR